MFKFACLRSDQNTNGHTNVEKQPCLQCKEDDYDCRGMYVVASQFLMGFGLVLMLCGALLCLRWWLMN